MIGVLHKVLGRGTENRLEPCYCIFVLLVFCEDEPTGQGDWQFVCDCTLRYCGYCHTIPFSSV